MSKLKQFEERLQYEELRTGRQLSIAATKRLAIEVDRFAKIKGGWIAFSDGSGCAC